MVKSFEVMNLCEVDSCEGVCVGVGWGWGGSGCGEPVNIDVSDHQSCDSFTFLLTGD